MPLSRSAHIRRTASHVNRFPSTSTSPREACCSTLHSGISRSSHAGTFQCWLWPLTSGTSYTEHSMGNTCSSATRNTARNKWRKDKPCSHHVRAVSSGGGKAPLAGSSHRRRTTSLPRRAAVTSHSRRWAATRPGMFQLAASLSGRRGALAKKCCRWRFGRPLCSACHAR